MEEAYREYFSSYEIKCGINRIATEINRQYGEDDELIVLCILKGGFIFCADLIRRLNCACKVEFITISSYEENKQKQLSLKYGGFEVMTKLKDKHVLILDDINDTGNTLSFVIDLCNKAKAKQIQSAVILQSNKSKLKADFHILYKTDDIWVFGYGMDNNDICRNLPSIYHKIDNPDV